MVGEALAVCSEAFSTVPKMTKKSRGGRMEGQPNFSLEYLAKIAVLCLSSSVFCLVFSGSERIYSVLLGKGLEPL